MCVSLHLPLFVANDWQQVCGKPLDHCCARHHSIGTSIQHTSAAKGSACPRALLAQDPCMCMPWMKKSCLHLRNMVLLPWHMYSSLMYGSVGLDTRPLLIQSSLLGAGNLRLQHQPAAVITLSQHPCEEASFRQIQQLKTPEKELTLSTALLCISL